MPRKSRSTKANATEKTAYRRAYGGVSPIPAKPATRGTETLHEQAGPVVTAALHSTFVYHGGPIIKCPQIITSYWGPHWSDAAHQTRANRLNQFIKDFLASKYMNILTQYGVGFGAGATGAFIKATFLANVPSQLNETIIHNTIQSCINAGAFPEPTVNSGLIIYLDESLAINDPGKGLVLCEPVHDTAFGYHSFFKTTAGNWCYYSIIPALDNTCLHASCPSDAGCSLHLAETQEQRQTQVTSHEFSEMVTDPQLNAWFETSSGAENGDICNGESSTITVGPNTWTVQKMYSKFDDIQTNGASFCVTQPPNPLPKLSPGPASGLTGAAVAPPQMASFDRLLPLPSAHFNSKTGKAQIDEKELLAYIKRVFSPLQAEHVIADIPAFLREAADILSKKKK